MKGDGREMGSEMTNALLIWSKSRTIQFSILDSWRRIGEGMLRGCEDWEMKGREWKGRLEMEME
jgi:hypothetical protein